MILAANHPRFLPSQRSTILTKVEMGSSVGDVNHDHRINIYCRHRVYQILLCYAISFRLKAVRHILVALCSFSAGLFATAFSFPHETDFVLVTYYPLLLVSITLALFGSFLCNPTCVSVHVYCACSCPQLCQVFGSHCRDACPYLDIKSINLLHLNPLTRNIYSSFILLFISPCYY